VHDTDGAEAVVARSAVLDGVAPRTGVEVVVARPAADDVVAAVAVFTALPKPRVDRPALTFSLVEPLAASRRCPGGDVVVYRFVFSSSLR
jgi:hypothetical protein